MRFGKGTPRPRNRRAFSFAAFDSEYRMEPRFLTAPLFYRTGGTNIAWATGGQPDTAPNYPSASGTNSWAIPAGQGAGYLDSTDLADADVTTATGPNGASSIAVNGALAGTLGGSVTQGFLPGGGAGAGVQSVNAAGAAAPLTWSVGNTNPAATSGTVTMTFQISGTDGINSTTSEGMMGAFQLQIITPELEIDLNEAGGPGLHASENPLNPMARTQVYNPVEPDGSAAGVINYNPGLGSTDGSKFFSGAFSASFSIPTNGGAGFSVAYNAGFNEIVNPGQTTGDHVQAAPSMQWTFNVTNS